MISAKNIGKELSKCRKQANMSQQELAKHLGVTAQAISKWENGESLSDIVKLYEILKILNINANTFFNSIEQLEEDKDDETSNNYNEVNLSFKKFSDVDFSKLEITEGKLRASSFLNVNFNATKFTRAIISANNFLNCDLSNSIINDSRIKSSSFKKTKFDLSSFEKLIISSTSFVDCPFQKIKINDTVFKTTQFKMNSISDSEVKNTKFRMCDFKNFAFINTNFQNVAFELSDVKHVVFQNCKMDRISYNLLAASKAKLNDVKIIN